MIKRQTAEEQVAEAAGKIDEITNKLGKECTDIQFEVSRLDMELKHANAKGDRHGARRKLAAIKAAKARLTKLEGIKTNQTRSKTALQDVGLVSEIAQTTRAGTEAAERYFKNSGVDPDELQEIADASEDLTEDMNSFMDVLSAAPTGQEEEEDDDVAAYLSGQNGYVDVKLPASALETEPVLPPAGTLSVNKEDAEQLPRFTI